jgi:hypothetical protein
MYIEEVRTLADAQQCGEEIIRSAWVSGFTLEAQLNAMLRLINRVHYLAVTPWTGRHVTFNDGTGERIGGVVTGEPQPGGSISITADDGRTFTRRITDVTIDLDQDHLHHGQDCRD